MSAFLPYRRGLRTLLGLYDLAALGGATFLAYLIRFDAGQRLAKWHELIAAPGLLFWAIASGWVIAIAAELYEPEVLHRRRETLARALVAVLAWGIGMVVATYVWPTWAYGRGLLLLTGGLWAAAMVTARWLVTERIRARRWRFPALVVGAPDTVEPFCRELAARPSAPWKPVDGSSVALDDIPRAIEDAGASIVILAGGHEHQEAMAPALARLHFSGVPVVAAAEVWAWLEERLPLEALTPGLFLHQPGFGAVHWTLFNRVTRIVDVVASLGLMVILSPVFLLALVAIRLFQGAPVFYRQERVGQYGRTFTLYKLRTMRRDAERDSGPTFAARADRRVTPVGAFLRRFRIDEMPQLWNILKGEMSLVGPRPERPTFVAELSEALPFYSFRLAVPPGLSGWAQVNHPYAANLEDHRRKLEFDLYFIRERSMRLYLLTLLRTVSAMLVGARTRPRKPSLSPSVEHRPVAPARSSS